MARRSSSRRSAISSPIATGTVLRRSSQVPLTLFEDRRSYFPETFRPARGVFSWSAGIVPSSSPKRQPGRAFAPPYGLSFAVPRDVFICVRRKRRREVLFAFKKTGKGARVRRRRRNEYSDVRC